MRLKGIYVIIFLFLLFSCTSKTNKRLQGKWSVDLDSSLVFHRDWNIVGNSMILDTKDCILPRIFNNKLNDDKGEWKLNSIKDTIFFDVPKNPLYGRYKVKFYKDYNKMQFKMRLSNDSTVLICSKYIVGYNANSLDFLRNY